MAVVQSATTFPEVGDRVETIRFGIDMLDTYKDSEEREDLGIWSRSKFERLKHHIRFIDGAKTIFESGKTSFSHTTRSSKDLDTIETLLKDGAVLVSGKSSYPDTDRTNFSTRPTEKGWDCYRVTLIKGNFKGFVIEDVTRNEVTTILDRL